ncbi:NACHT domain-containing protein [Actinoplanes sp. GCM10030250]|uniref:NACHT domain-containing protein n=1 Tax=Actinoplanes sp. GCM10030250 TaxID=3273376 RepID=UPI00361EE3EA
MSRSLSYADAVRILGGQSQAVTVIDRATGGLLLAATAGGSALALSLFDARSELFRTTQGLVADLGDRLAGLNRIDRTQRLAAGHAALVTCAYFGALPSPEITGTELVHLATGARPGGERLGDLARALLHSDVPMPAPHQPYEDLLTELEAFYRRLSDSVLRFLSGLAAWDDLGGADRDRIGSALRGAVVEKALADYQSGFRRMAGDVPEFGFWVNLLDHQATRRRMDELTVGVAALRESLGSLAPRRAAAEKRTALSRAYTAALLDPVLDAESGDAGPNIPDIASSYINPSFRVSAVTPQVPLAAEEWWEQVPAQDDLMRFLVGHLTSMPATAGPLLLLGQPGSGKSLLTRMLAATLPPEDFAVVRVPLRDVPADASLQVQIEQAIFDATGERATWPEVVGAIPGALPVVLLDGFDELLQATGVSQWDYLQNVARFQAREAAEGRAVAVVVTTRTAVADRARPVPDTVALRLEPFTDEQIARWLTVWNTANEAYFRAAGLLPLSLAAVTGHPELASQPLLLLMLAIYDAQDNALAAGAATDLDQADLYERLLSRFAWREVLKEGAGHPESHRQVLVEEELLRLSLVAFAAFNRGRQWVTEADLDADLPVLLRTGTTGPAATVRRVLTVGETVLGRFFFIHEARARRDGQALQTYEFLHATFGEYLGARALERELADLVEDDLRQSRRSRTAPTDDDYLHALLSFSPISQRRTLLDFLTDRLAGWPTQRRDALRPMLLGLFHRALDPRERGRYADYAPAPLSLPARHAVYSANLVLLLVATGAALTTDELFPDTDDRIDEWRRLTLLWRSQLRVDAWSRLVGTIGVQRQWAGEQRVLVLSRDTSWPNAAAPASDLYWTRDVLTADKDDPEFLRGHFSWTQGNDRLRQWQANFHCDPLEDLARHALEPLETAFEDAVIIVHGYWQDRAISAAQSLITLWLRLSVDSEPEELLDAFRVAIDIAWRGFPPTGVDARRTYRIIVLRALRDNQVRLGPAACAELRHRFEARTATREPDDLAALINRILGAAPA